MHEYPAGFDDVAIFDEYFTDRTTLLMLNGFYVAVDHKRSGSDDGALEPDGRSKAAKDADQQDDCCESDERQMADGSLCFLGVRKLTPVECERM